MKLLSVFLACASLFLMCSFTGVDSVQENDILILNNDERFDVKEGQHDFRNVEFAINSNNELEVTTPSETISSSQRYTSSVNKSLDAIEIDSEVEEIIRESIVSGKNLKAIGYASVDIMPVFSEDNSSIIGYEPLTVDEKNGIQVTPQMSTYATGGEQTYGTLVHYTAMYLDTRGTKKYITTSSNGYWKKASIMIGTKNYLNLLGEDVLTTYLDTKGSYIYGNYPSFGVYYNKTSDVKNNFSYRLTVDRDNALSYNFTKLYSGMYDTNVQIVSQNMASRSISSGANRNVKACSQYLHTYIGVNTKISVSFSDSAKFGFSAGAELAKKSWILASSCTLYCYVLNHRLEMNQSMLLRMLRILQKY